MFFWSSVDTAMLYCRERASAFGGLSLLPLWGTTPVRGSVKVRSYHCEPCTEVAGQSHISPVDPAWPNFGASAEPT